MSELPVAGMKVEFARQIGPDAARAPKLRVIILGLPCLGGRAEAAHVRRKRPNLLRVTVGASFAPVNDSASLFGRGEHWHGDGSRALDFICQFLSRKDVKNKKRKAQETHPLPHPHSMRTPEPT